MRDDQDLNTAFSDTENTLAQTNAPQASDYLEELEGDDYNSLSESEKLELLEALFIIMKSYVNLGYGLDPVNKLIAKFENSSNEPIPMVDCEDATDGEE